VIKDCVDGDVSILWKWSKFDPSQTSLNNAFPIKCKVNNKTINQSWLATEHGLPIPVTENMQFWSFD